MASRRRPAAPQRRGEAVVQRVLDVAVRELARVGFERLSVPDVAAKAGVNKTSVYRRWPTKEALVRAALKQSMAHVRDVPDTGALETDLAALARTVADFVESARGTGVVRSVFAGARSPAVRSLAASMWAEAGGDVPRVLVERAVARGELPPDADVELLLFTVAGALLHRVFIEHATVDDAWVARLVRLVLDGARAPRRRGTQAS